MAELVEQRARVVEGKQGGFAGRWLGEVTHVQDDRADITGKLFLVAHRGRPGAAVFGTTREVVADKKRHVAAPRIGHIPGARIGMIERHGRWLEREPEQTA